MSAADSNCIRKLFNQKTMVIVFILLTYITVFAFSCARARYGVEISDEAYYVAEAYIVSKGAIPFTDNWTQTPGTTLLYAPLVKLFVFATGGTEGIFLFMRQAFLVFKLFISLICVLLLRRHIPLPLALLFVVPYFSMTILSTNNFSYNTISLSLLLISSILLFSSMREEDKGKSRIFSALCGFTMGLTVLAHLMQLFNSMLVLVLIIVYERKKYKTASRAIIFALSGLSTGLFVFVYLSIVSGGLKPVFDGILTLLLQPYWHIEKTGLSGNIRALISTLVVFRILLIFLAASFFGLLILNFLLSRFFKVKKFEGIEIYGFAVFLAQISFILFTFHEYYTFPEGMTISLSTTFFYALFLLIPGIKEKRKLSMDFMLFIMLPFMAFFLMQIPFAWTGVAMRGYILFPSAMLSILFTFFILERIPSLIFSSQAGKDARDYGLVILLTFLVAALHIAGYYGYVYRDAPVSELTYKMEKGVYKGIYTKEQRGKALIFLEEEIKRLTNEEDTVLFMNQAPEAYLMTKAEHCAPSTWDITLYSYNFTDDQLLHKYFKAAHKVPSKIIYIRDRERQAQLSLEQEDYPFNKYLKQNYKLVYANNEEHFQLILFEKL